MLRRQKPIKVPEVVLAELACRISLRLECGCECCSFVGDAHVGTCLTDSGQTGADRQLARNEVGATRRAACFRVVVGEAHALGGKPVEVRRLAGHDALVIGTDVEPPDIVAHDDEDVGLSGLSECRYGSERCHQQTRGGYASRQQSMEQGGRKHLRPPRWLEVVLAPSNTSPTVRSGDVAKNTNLYSA